MIARYERIVVLILISCFIFLSIFSALRESLTYDEIVYKEEGLNAWIHQRFDIDPYNPPFIREILTLPFYLGISSFISSAYPNYVYFPGRIMNVLLAVLCILLVYHHTKSKFGLATALSSLFILTFDPNLLSHSHYITLDTGTTLFYVGAVFSLFNFLNQKSGKSAVNMGLAFGAAFASRILLLFALPVVVIMAVILNKIKLNIHLIKKFLVAIFLSLLVLWATFFYTREVIVVRHENPDRVSSKIRNFFEAHNNVAGLFILDRLQGTPVPLGNYIGKIKNTVLRIGKNKYEWHATLSILFLKTPIPLFLLFIFSCVFHLTLQTSRKQIYTYLIPVITLLGISLISGMAPLVRYMLPIYPFVAIIAGMGVTHLFKKYRVMAILLGIWYIVGTLWQAPHFISYANEFAGEPDSRFELMTDSNLDWGQGLITLADYVREQDPASVRLSYFGRDDAAAYGFISTVPYGSYKADQICAFHPVYWGGTGREISIISVSNWYECRYNEDGRFTGSLIVDVVGNSFLVFNQ